MNNNLPEAPAVAYTGIKTKTGFHWSFTMRADSVSKLVEQIEHIEKVFTEKGWEAEEIRGSYGTKQKAEKKYVEGRFCPKDGGRLVDTEKSIKCENNKWNPTTKQSYGCPFIEWKNAK